MGLPLGPLPVWPLILEPEIQENKKEVTVFYDIITYSHFHHILLVGSESVSPAYAQGERN